MTYVSTEPDPDGAPATSERAGSRRALGCAFEIVETLVLTLLIYLVIHNFLAQPFEVQQTSMMPTIAPGEYVLIDKLTPRFDGFHYGDVVVFEPPGGSGLAGGSVPFIKRVIGLPGDTVELVNGEVFVTPVGEQPVLIDEPYLALAQDGTPDPTSCRDVECTTEWTVPEGAYFVMGDNRGQSQDSRTFGPIERDLILGRAWIRYFPIDRFGIVERPSYDGLPDREAQAEAAWSGPPASYVRAGSSATIHSSIARP
jgi:signal peptidase I